MKTIATLFALVTVIFLSVSAPVSAQPAASTAVASYNSQPLNELEAFFLKNKKSVLKSIEWSMFVSAVTIYHENSAVFMQLPESQRVAFNNATTKLNAALAKIKGEEAAQFQADILTLARNMNVSWSFDARKFVPSTENETESNNALLQ